MLALLGDIAVKHVYRYNWEILENTGKYWEIPENTWEILQDVPIITLKYKLV